MSRRQQCLAIGAVSAVTIIVLITVDITTMISGNRIPALVRHWFMWGTSLGVLTAIVCLKNATLDTIRTNQKVITKRLDAIETTLKRVETRLTDLDTRLADLHTGDGIRDAVHNEVNNVIDNAVETAVAPHLAAVADYQATAEQATHISRLHPRN